MPDDDGPYMDSMWLVTVTLCTYEVTAIMTKVVTRKDTIPTITKLHRRYNWVGLALTAAMGYHFLTSNKKRITR